MPPGDVRDEIVISPGLQKPAGGSPLAVIEITLAMMRVVREAMAICGADSRPLASNNTFRNLRSEFGEPFDALVARSMVGQLGVDRIKDDILQLEARAAMIGAAGGAELFVVAVFDAGSSPTVTSRMVRTVRESLERALRSIEEPDDVMPKSLLNPDRPFTGKEDEIFALLAGGLRVSSIARSLQVSESTVRSHLKSIFRKSGVHSQAALFEKLHTLGGSAATARTNRE